MSAAPLVEIIIPLASRAVAKDWGQMCDMLQGTLGSVLALPTPFASVSMIGHEQPENFPSDARCRWTSVTWNPPDKNDLLAKVNDKGNKIRQGVRDAFARRTKWVMFLDADDRVSNRLPANCDFEHHEAICFANGYSWSFGEDYLLKVPRFHYVCGSSWIMRLEPHLFPLWLGSGTHRVCDIAHNEREPALRKVNARIQVINKPMAIYCIGHQTASGFGESLGQKSGNMLFHPISTAKTPGKRIIRGRRLTAALRREFAIAI